MDGAVSGETMTLLGVPLAPGRATGPVRSIAGLRPEEWEDGPVGRIVASATRSSLPPSVGPPAVLGVIVEGLPVPPFRGATVPVVGGIDRDVFVDGDRAEIDGDSGQVTLAGVTETHVVTAFLERDDGRILLLRRSARVGSFQGRWAAVSGYLEDPTAEGQAIREVGEETGIPAESLTLRRAGSPVYARDGARIWAVHPFRFGVGAPAVRIDWEHTEFEWVAPEEIGRRPTVPKLDRAWTAVAGPESARQKR